MTMLFGQARLGRDAEIRYTPSGEAVASLSLAFSYYDKNADKGRGTQWVDGSLWGKRAEQLAPYLKKGGLISVTLEDVHIEEYQGKNGAGHKLVGKIIAIELGTKADSSGAAAPAPAPRAAAPAPRPAPAPAPRPAGGAQPSGFDDMDGDIPFAFADYSTEQTTSLGRRMRRYRF